MVVAFRLANWDTPLWVNPNRRESRFRAAHGDIVQYWTLHPLAGWAEQLRYHNIRSPNEADELRVRPWVAEMAIPDDALHVSFNNADKYDIAPDALIDDDWTACQRWIHGLRIPGLIVPSAALPGTENLILFGAKVRTRWGITPRDPSLEVPCEPLADVGSVIADLLPHVRWQGEPHAGYQAWLQGAPQPSPPLVRLTRRP